MAGLTTRTLADRLGIDQSRVSRLEHARAVPNPDEVERWALTCGLSDADAKLLAEQAQSARVQTVDWRDTEPGGLIEQQQRVAAREADAVTIRTFHPEVVYGLLQTPAYVRACLALTGSPDLDAAAAARLARQAVLYEPGKTIDVLLTEGALRWRPGSHAMLAAQLLHLERAPHELASVRLGLIPFSAQAPTWYQHGFTIYSDIAGGEPAMIEVESIEGEKTSTVPEIVAQYEARFELLRTAAVYGDAAEQLLNLLVGELVG